MLLDAAITCFGRSSFHATTIDHIAKQADLSKGSVYRYFKSKDEILLAILDKFNREITELTESALESVEHPLEQIRLGIETSIVYLNQQKDMERVWAEFSYHPHTRKNSQ